MFVIMSKLSIKKILLTIIGLCFGMGVWAQQEAPDVRRGNRNYKLKNYTEADVDYRRGLLKNDSAFEANFNLGDALYRQEKYPNAIEQFEKAVEALEMDEKIKPEKKAERMAATYHNIGNAYYVQQQYDQAVSAYQKSLRHNPKDDETRYNLVKAMQQLEQQQQQQQQQQQNQDKQQQQQQQDQNQDKDQDQNQDQQQQPQNQDQMDRETAEQILKALEQDEQETQAKLQRQQGRKKSVEKNW